MKTAAFVVLASMVSACSSASSSGGTLAPAPVDANGPNGSVAPPSLPPSGPSMPPPNDQRFEGCPATREESDVAITGVDDVRARLAGVYRGCQGGGTGLELRIDPDSDVRLLWYMLDSRFVRLADAGTSGSIDIGECEGAVCTVAWQSNGDSDEGLGISRELTVYADPTAFRITSDYSGTSWTEYIRIAD